MKILNAFFFVCLLLPGIVRAQQNSDVQQALENLIADPKLLAAEVGISVKDVTSGENVFSYRAQKAMIPASMMKLASSIAALQTFEADKSWKTMLFHDGQLDAEGTLHGNLYLVGEGDPTFGSSRLGESAQALTDKFAAAINAAGIRKIVGDIVVDETAFIPQVPGTWSWEDLTNYYAAIPHAVNFMDNQFTMTFETYEPGVAAKMVRTDPEIPGLKLDAQVIGAEISNDQTFCFGHPLQDEITVHGMLPANRKSYSVKGAIPQPGALFARRVIDAAKSMGVMWRGEVRVDYEVDQRIYEDAHQLIVHQSPPLKSIVREMNLRSVNLYAEALTIIASREWQNTGTSAAKLLEDFWKSKLPSTQGMRIEDGSGLSHYNTLTADQLVEILQVGYKSPNKTWLLQSLPVAGQSGSLTHFGRGTDLEGNIRAKSGYMTGNRGYAGFLTLRSGRSVAFAIIVNNYDISAVEMRRKIEQFIVVLQQSE